MFEKYKQIIVFDVETTGLDYMNDQIIEFGALVLNNQLEPVREISTLVRSEEPLPEKIKEITNITDEMLKDGIEEETLAELLKDVFTDNSLVVAYNLQFDISFLKALFQRFLIPYVDNDVLDCMIMYKHKHPVGRHNLKTALTKYNSPYENSHRALDDVKGTAYIMKEMVKESDMSSFINYITYGYYGLYGVTLPRVKYEKK